MAQPVHVMLARTLVSQQNETSAIVAPTRLVSADWCAVRATVVSRSSLRVLSGTSLSSFRLRLMLDLKSVRVKRLSQRTTAPSRKLATHRRRLRRRRLFRSRRFWRGRPPFVGYSLSLASRNLKRRRAAIKPGRFGLRR
jgi:hypothetical protein